MTFPGSEAKPDPWGCLIETTVRKQVAFKELVSSDTLNVTETILFIRLAEPSDRTCSNKKL